MSKAKPQSAAAKFRARWIGAEKDLVKARAELSAYKTPPLPAHEPLPDKQHPRIMISGCTTQEAWRFVKSGKYLAARAGTLRCYTDPEVEYLDQQDRFWGLAEDRRLDCQPWVYWHDGYNDAHRARPMFRSSDLQANDWLVISNPRK